MEEQLGYALQKPLSYLVPAKRNRGWGSPRKWLMFHHHCWHLLFCVSATTFDICDKSQVIGKMRRQCLAHTLVPIHNRLYIHIETQSCLQYLYYLKYHAPLYCHPQKRSTQCFKINNLYTISGT